jgi:hypothetical protein
MLLAGGAVAAQHFHPRVKGAFGLEPRLDLPEIATGANLPVVYHGGSVMRNVTIHSIFWAPSGHQFDAAPSPSTLSYEALIQQFFTDAAADSGTTSNLFSILKQYGDGGGPGSYELHYSVGADSINDTDPYPAKSKQCASPTGIETCVTDLQGQQEVDKMISSHDPSGRGLHDIWFVFLPPDVDECISPGSCGTNAFAGYHSLGNVGHGAFFYVTVIDPLIEFSAPPGADPQSNPDAEESIDTAAHETVESMTNPEGNGWMDPNGFEVADDCENPELGTPLGYAPDGSPYNELVNGHQYLIQEMWSNTVSGCVQRSASSTSALPLATVDLTQFNRKVTGNTGIARAGVSVHVSIIRAGAIVASGSGKTRANGSWGPVSLAHAVGDDRDVVIVSYGAGGPRGDVIQTGNGGNAFTESGYTGWFDLDYGFDVGNAGVLLGPCSQTGTLTLTIGGVATPSPIEQCQTETGVAIMQTHAITPATKIEMSSQDDRAISGANPNGALVKLSIQLGEPDSISALGNAQVPFEPSGFPICLANLETQATTCAGLVPGEGYTLTRHRGHATRHAKGDLNGEIRITGVRIRGGDQLTLRNAAHRQLTTLHVAHLRVGVDDAETALASGTCQPGEYYGSPITRPPVSPLVDVPGVSGAGRICPLGGHARGLSAGNIEQTDDLSGGLTRTELVGEESISPNRGATLYGPFVAQAQPAVFGANSSVVPAHATVSLSIFRGSSNHRLLFLRNVAKGRGVRVHSLRPGAYRARWVVQDRNGDTDTIHTRFVEAR